MKITAFAGTALAALLTLSPAAQAHKLWLLPSHTVVSEAQWITVDASVSNDIFDVDRPFPLEGLSVTGPDGKDAPVDHRFEGHRRSSFDAELSEEGSYRITLFRPMYMAFYQLDGERHRRRGDSAEALLREIPDGARDVRLSEVVNRLETFATVGAPSAFKPVGKGLELQPVTHPNDLYTGETALFRFLIDGEPAPGVEVEVVPGGSRYRDNHGALTATSDDNGEIKLQWPKAGRYHLEAAYSDDRASHPKAAGRRLQYMGTFEVLPL